MNIKEKLKNSPLYLSMKKTFRSNYIFILIIPLMFNTLCYTYSRSIIKENNSVSVQNNLIGSRSFLDSNLDSIIYCASQISSDDTIMQMAYLKHPLTSQQRYDLSQSNDIWETYKSTNKYVRNMYIYYPESSSVYTGSTITPAHFFYMYTYPGEIVMSEQLWSDAILSKAASGYVSIASDDGYRIFFTYATHKTNSKEIWYNTIIEVDLYNLMTDASGKNANDFFIYISDGTVISVNGYAKLIQTVRNAQCKELSMDHNISSGDGIYKIKSKAANWEYGYIENGEYIKKSLADLGETLIFICLLTAFISLLLILYLINKNEKPLMEIADLLPDIENRNGKNIYKQINASLSKVLGEKENYASRLNSQNNILKDSILANILTGKKNDRFTYEEQLSLVGINMDNNMFATIAMCPSDMSRIFGEDNPHGTDSEKLNLAQVIISNILLETLSKYYKTEIVNMENLCVAIINITDEQTEKFKEDVTSVLETSFDIIYSEFNFSVVAAVSNIHISLSCISDAYNESVLCTEYALTQKQAISFYDEVGIKAKNPYSLEIEEDIARCLSENNYRQCKKVIENVIYKFQLNKDMTAAMARSFACDLLTTFFKYVIPNSSDTSGRFLAGVEMNSIMSENATASSILLKTITIIERYLDEHDNSENTETDAGKSNFYLQVKNYIDENFSNPDLSVTELSSIFKTNSSYLSSQFKKEFDVGLLDYITSVRIAAAKKLLITTDESNDEISKHVGYSNTRTFLRAFSKHENITPKEYRRINNPSV